MSDTSRYTDEQIKELVNGLNNAIVSIQEAKID
uniref:Uncharacterized protein n=1 Tax=Bacteriophage sp. TaxID=38018 RepID=A0A8D9PEZ9_9VIRU|nr:MAG TPA: hypothetical protein [Bacteriophage sp.]